MGQKINQCLFLLLLIVTVSCGDLHSDLMNPALKGGKITEAGADLYPAEDVPADVTPEASGSTSTGVGNPANDGATSTAVGNPSFNLNEKAMLLEALIKNRLTIVANKDFIELEEGLKLEDATTVIYVNNEKAASIMGADYGDEVLFEESVKAQENDVITIVVHVTGSANQTEKLEAVAGFLASNPYRYVDGAHHQQKLDESAKNQKNKLANPPSFSNPKDDFAKSHGTLLEYMNQQAQGNTPTEEADNEAADSTQQAEVVEKKPMDAMDLSPQKKVNQPVNSQDKITKIDLDMARPQAPKAFECLVNRDCSQGRVCSMNKCVLPK